jgi:hypothetical protein
MALNSSEKKTLSYLTLFAVLLIAFFFYENHKFNQQMSKSDTNLNLALNSLSEPNQKTQFVYNQEFSDYENSHLMPFFDLVKITSISDDFNDGMEFLNFSNANESKVCSSVFIYEAEGYNRYPVLLNVEHGKVRAYVSVQKTSTSKQDVLNSLDELNWKIVGDCSYSQLNEASWTSTPEQIKTLFNQLYNYAFASYLEQYGVVGSDPNGFAKNAKGQYSIHQVTDFGKHGQTISLSKNDHTWGYTLNYDETLWGVNDLRVIMLSVPYELKGLRDSPRWGNYSLSEPVKVFENMQAMKKQINATNPNTMVFDSTTSDLNSKLVPLPLPPLPIQQSSHTKTKQPVHQMRAIDTVKNVNNTTVSF